MSEKDYWNLSTWGDDIIAFCDRLQLEKPIIAGVSMGGHVICDILRKKPELAGKLIFCNTEARWRLADTLAALRDMGGEEAARVCQLFMDNPTSETLEQYANTCVPYYAKNAYSVAEVARCIQHPDVFLHYVANEMLDFDYLERYGKYQLPSLVFGGCC